MVPWWELEIDVPAELADDVAGLMVADGASGVELAECRNRSYVVRAGYPGSESRAAVAAAAHAALASLGLSLPADQVRIRQRVDGDWAERWKEHFRPLALGRRVWIVPSWHSDFVPPPDAVTLMLDPSLAFGTGQHETTAMCVEWLESTVDEVRKRDGAAAHLGVLDVGCGSGILGIACARLGVGTIVGTDIDPVATRVARDNVSANGVARQVTIVDSPIAEIEQTFDWVVANILAVTLEELAPELLRHVRPGGRLVLGGVLSNQASHLQSVVNACATRAGRQKWRQCQRLARDEWVTLVLGD
jgi:ribosomal protein L11 methyltransferase